LKPGDLVRIRKAAIDEYSIDWFIYLAEKKTPLLLMEKINEQHWKVMRPDGSTCFLSERKITKRLW